MTGRGEICKERDTCALAFSPRLLNATKKTRASGREGMSRALAVFHGRFGRATVYQLNRPFNIHAHREGHLIFHVGGRPACIDVNDGRYELTEGSVVAVNPWEPHNFLPSDLDGGAVFFVLYVNAEWFAPDAPGAGRPRFWPTP